MSLRHQCELLSVPRSSYYYEPVPTPAGDLALLRELDALYLAEPAWGSRKIAAYFALQQRPVSRGRIRRLRKILGQETIYCRPRTSLPSKQAQPYPYLLRGRKILLPDEVWCADITYVPMLNGYLYLFAIMDWVSRKVLAWDISNTLDADFCIRCLESALAASLRANRKLPDIFNTDQGSQFTGERWTGTLLAHGVLVSHDGRGRWMDNVFIERLWRSIKHDDIYPKAYADGPSLWTGVADWFYRYNEVRPHQALGNITPAMAYENVVKS